MGISRTHFSPSSSSVIDYPFPNSSPHQSHPLPSLPPHLNRNFCLSLTLSTNHHHLPLFYFLPEPGSSPPLTSSCSSFSQKWSPSPSSRLSFDRSATSICAAPFFLFWHQLYHSFFLVTVSCFLSSVTVEDHHHHSVSHLAVSPPSFGLICYCWGPEEQGPLLWPGGAVGGAAMLYQWGSFFPSSSQSQGSFFLGSLGSCFKKQQFVSG